MFVGVCSISFQFYIMRFISRNVANACIPSHSGITSAALITTLVTPENRSHALGTLE